MKAKAVTIGELTVLLIDGEPWFSVPQIAAMLDYTSTTSNCVANLVGREHRMTVETPVLRQGRSVGIIDLEGVKLWCGKTYHKNAARSLLEWLEAGVLPILSTAEKTEVEVADVLNRWKGIASWARGTRVGRDALSDKLYSDNSLTWEEIVSRLDEYYESRKESRPLS